MKIALLFDGQGTQFVGMGKDLYQQDANFKTVIDKADHIMNVSLSTIMFDSKKLHDTLYAQPALFAFGAGMLAKLKAAGIEAEGAAGLSLGEYLAYYDAGVLSFSQGLETVIHRAFFMHEAAQASNTKMVALLGKTEAARALIDAIDGCEAANFNGPNQTVVGCSADLVDTVVEQAKTYGIKRAQPINTAAAFHTSYMASAAWGFEFFLKNIALNDANKPLYVNTTGRLVENDLKETMVQQITAPVQFHRMIVSMVEDGFDTFIEIGPQAILKPLIKKIAPDVNVHTVTNGETFEACISALKGRQEHV